MKTKKLYHNTSSHFSLPIHVSENLLITATPANNIPMIRWPDGRWCTEANVYMLRLFNRGLSRKGRGGTLLTYATNISHLIRFCHSNKIDFINLTDNEFTLFIKTLIGQRSSDSRADLKRNANSVIAIGRNCLDFLSCVSKFYNDEWFIGETGRIRGEKRRVDTRKGRRTAGFISKTFWHHPSFPTPDPIRKRSPIDTETIKKLREAVLPTSGSIFQRKRRYVMLKLLEITGGRRAEVALLTVESVRAASKMTEPLLKLITLKRRVETYRMIPVEKHDLAFLIEYIEKNRSRVVRRTLGLESDKGTVLVSETTGNPLAANTITQEVSLLAKAAGITVQTCPHMFRHRFVTKLFVALIEQHELENSDQFRKTLLDSAKMKQKIQQWTGHSTIESLAHYIDLAFDEVGSFAKTYRTVLSRLSLHSLAGTLTQIKEEMRQGMSPSEASDYLERVIKSLEVDLGVLPS